MITMLNKNRKCDWLGVISINPANHMQITAEKLLNPYCYHLSSEAKKRLRWLYILYYDRLGNVTEAANKIGVSRPWLSKIKSIFERSRRDPRSLEPQSKAPRDVSSRKRISQDAENKIIAVRNEYGWGKDKISAFLRMEYGLRINPNTVNKYLHKRKKINPKISLKNIKAWEIKKRKEQDAVFKVKFRPPAKIKDYAPGALIEKDMKYIAKIGSTAKYKTGNDFRYQQTIIDSLTRIRVMELTEDFASETVALAHQEALKRLPFSPACVNTDNGSENNGEFSAAMQAGDVFHFYSNAGTPTDNPRVERSHLTDDLEFYGRGNVCKDFKEQKECLRKWEYVYNFKRPHQALGYLTPMKFYELWKTDPEKAHEITDRWRAYLLKQSKRLAESRRIKRKDQVDNLMKFIDAKLNENKGLEESKLQLINCQLCSVA